MLTPSVHTLIRLLFEYTGRHNDMIDAGDTEHLNPITKLKAQKKRKSVPYDCTPKKVMKRR